MGNPMFLLLNDAALGRERIKNMVNGLNVSIDGNVNKRIHYKLAYYWFKNQGTYRERFDPHFFVHSYMATTKMALKNGNLSITGIFQEGNLLGRNVAINVAYSTRLFSFSKPNPAP